MKLIGLTALTLLIVAASAGPVEELNTATRTFAAKLYTELIRNRQSHNVIFSPLAIQSSMALVSSASRNESRKGIQQIRSAVSLPWSENNTVAAFKQVLEGLNHAENDFKVFLATKMYLKHGYRLENWYQHIAQNVYSSEIEAVNFDDRLTTSRYINQWIAKKTDNRIPYIIGSNDLSILTENLLINTLYLIGLWDKPFDQEYNIFQTFKGFHGPRLVTMMNAQNDYYYFEDNEAQYLSMDMLREGGGAELIFVLPRNIKGLSQLETNIPALLESKAFQPMLVNVTLPKFSIGSDIKLKPVLQNLGMERIFEFGTKLEGMHYPGHPWNKITDLLHKAVIQVGECGVNTARRSCPVMIYADEYPGDKKTFFADHPFLFYITVDDAVVFAGRVVQV